MSADVSKSSAFFRWNAGGWFGSQLGCTAWLLSGAFEFLWKDALLTSCFLLSFAVVNIWGLFLWSRRDRLTAYTGLQCLLAGCSTVLTLLIILINIRGFSAVGSYLVIGFGPFLMLRFYLLERLAKSTQEKPLTS